MQENFVICIVKMVLRNNKDFPNKVFGNKKDSAQIFCWVDGCARKCGDGKELKVIYVHAFEEHEQPL